MLPRYHIMSGVRVYENVNAARTERIARNLYGHRDEDYE